MIEINEKYKNEFKEYMYKNNWGEDAKNSSLVVFEYIYYWETVAGKSVSKMKKAEILNYATNGITLNGRKNQCKLLMSSYCSLYKKLYSLNSVLKYLGSKVELTIRDFDISAFDNNIKKHFTKSEIQEICDIFINAQDKFIVYAIFSGVLGKSSSDLLELKVNDLDMDKRTITCPNTSEVIHMDDYLYKITKDVIDPFEGGYYHKYMSSANKSFCGEGYDLSWECPYVIKTKPYSCNDNGMNCMKKDGLATRLTTLSKLISNEDVGYIFTPTDLFRSGMMYEMYEIQLRDGIYWSDGNIKKWVKENKFKASSYELYRSYHKKYTNTDKK